MRSEEWQQGNEEHSGRSGRYSVTMMFDDEMRLMRSDCSAKRACWLASGFLNSDHCGVSDMLSF